MDPQDPDRYISKFEELVCHAGYNINDPLTIGHYTKGLPWGLYETIYQFDNPRTFEAWRAATLNRQSQWYHMEAQRNLDKFQNSLHKPTFSQQAFQIPTCHPDAMDTSADHSWARIADTQEEKEELDRRLASGWHPSNDRRRGGAPPPRGGFIQCSARPNFNEITCYICCQKGHIT